MNHSIQVVMISTTSTHLRVEADPYKVSWIEASGAQAIAQAEATAAGGKVAVSWSGVPTCTPDVSSCDIDFNKTDADEVAAFRTLISSADVTLPFSKYEYIFFQMISGLSGACSRLVG